MKWYKNKNTKIKWEKIRHKKLITKLEFKMPMQKTDLIWSEYMKGIQQKFDTKLSTKERNVSYDQTKYRPTH